MAPSILVADCRDSFVHTIVDYLLSLGAEVTVRGIETIRAQEFSPDDFDGLLLSPGPGTPAQVPVCHQLLDRFAGVRPVLGVCLGHQVIAAHYGAVVSRVEPRHGETSPVRHDGNGVFAGLPNPLRATRYHSLAVEEAGLDRVPLTVSARTPDGVVMGVRHTSLPIEGVQFHPEAILSQSGHKLLRNWLAVTNARLPVKALPSGGLTVR